MLSLKKRTFIRNFLEIRSFNIALKDWPKNWPKNWLSRTTFQKIFKVRGSFLEGSVRLRKSKPRFGRFEVRFSRGSEVRGSEFSGSTQD